LFSMSPTVLPFAQNPLAFGCSLLILVVATLILMNYLDVICPWILPKEDIGGDGRSTAWNKIAVVCRRRKRSHDIDIEKDSPITTEYTQSLATGD